MKRKKNSLQIIKHAIFITLPLTIVLFLILSAISSFQDKTEMLLVKGDVKNHMTLIQDLITKDFEFVKSDLQILSESIILSEFIINKNNFSREKIENSFLLFSKRKKLYDQIRFIDNNGMEKVRINYNSGDPFIVEMGNLQNKKDRYYFSDTFKLNRGEIFVSPLDLNIEKSKVELPFKPMIRFGIPVFDKNNVKRGIVLLNYFGKNILNKIIKHSISFEGEVMLLNPSGYWLLGPKKEDEWGFMLNGRNNKIFSGKYSEEWDSLNTIERNQFKTKNGLFTFETIYPIREVLESSFGSEYPNSISINLLDGSKYYWKLLILNPMEQLNAKFSVHRSSTNTSLFFLSLVIFVLSLFLAKARLLRRTAEKEKESALQILQISEQKLIEENAAKDKFFSIISHDLKSPFQGLLGFSNLLATDHRDYSEDELDTALNSINNSALNIFNLLEGLLDWSRIQTGRFKCDPVILNIFSISESICNLLLLSAKKKNISILNSIDKDLTITIDKILIETVLRNLVGNAIKFTPDGGTIKIYNKAFNSKVQLFVEDNGIGINKENLDKLFKLDIHHTTNGTENEQGTGLGLLLCKDLLEKTGGDISVESEVGIGSKFIISLPIK